MSCAVVRVVCAVVTQRLELDQFITRFVEDNAPPLTERVIREGAGYPTTVRVRAINSPPPQNWVGDGLLSLPN
jgi:hypothetical protein